MLTTAKTTTETTYEYGADGKMTKKTVVETGDVIAPTVTTVYPDPDEIETGVELEGIAGVSPFEAFIYAALGAFLGNALYRIIHKD